MQCTENDFPFFGFTSDFWEQSPVNEGPISLGLLVLTLYQTLYYYRLQFIIFTFLNQNVQFGSFLVFILQDCSRCLQ